MFLLEETPIIPSAERNRGVWLDSNLSMSTHFNRDSGARLVHNLSSSVIKKIKRVQNMAARLIYCRSKFLSHHPLELHRLSVTYRIQCKILVITYKVPHGMVPAHLGPVSRKSRDLFGPEKPFVKLRPAFSGKLVFSYVVKGIKIKITAKFRASRLLRFEDTKRIISPEIRPKSFGTFEKQAQVRS